ncbi:MAG TPA: cadmium resistance transporter [Amycolatopsis sp.]|uniref:cadmium resistance transporter n=1 Tax=Amycolatopsis sp. TaxID=37632 RepID=UPI002B487B13|nr:cadmium resistance transporter [Amycolatopsis sp.]HKS49628.1 cadmium resistance transporter [Amycolatopsis sp.]
MLFAAARAGGTWAWRVVLGQFVGYVMLVGVSVAAAFVFASVPLKWVGLLGLFPLVMGIRGLLEARKEVEDPRITDSLPVIVTLILSVCVDNLSVYIVLFRSQTTAESAVSITVFAVLEALWCAVAYTIANQKAVILAIRRAGAWLVPAVFVAIGVAIGVRTGLL